MKRLLLGLAAAALPFTAAASPQLATQWGVKAGDLRAETADLIAEIDADGRTSLPDSYESDIARFASAATQLGHWIDGNDGPSDLGCIFRGMAEEGDVQLEALDEADSPADTRQSLVRLATMFSDAETIAVAAASANRHETPAVGSEMASCAASPEAASAALE